MNPFSKKPRSTFGKGGKRADLGNKYFRSKMEANCARYLNWLVSIGDIAKWEHEPEEFWFDGIKRGCRSYLPDFKIWPTSGDPYYLEVKGYMDAQSKTKLKRMAKYHPTVKVELMDKKRFSAIEKQVGGMIKGWE